MGFLAIFIAVLKLYCGNKLWLAFYVLGFHATFLANEKQDSTRVKNRFLIFLGCGCMF